MWKRTPQETVLVNSSFQIVFVGFLYFLSFFLLSLICSIISWSKTGHSFVSHRCFMVIIRPKQVLCCLTLIIACVLFFFYLFISFLFFSIFFFIIIRAFSDVLAIAPVTLIKPKKSRLRPWALSFQRFQVTGLTGFFSLLWVSGAAPSRPRC